MKELCSKEVIAVNKNRIKQIILVILLLLTAAIIVFLTTQSSEDTSKLTETVKNRLSAIGLDISFHRLRSFAHLPEFFAVGVLLALLFHSIKKTPVYAVITGFVLSTADECARIFIPRREFDLSDLMIDYAGIILGVLLVCAFYRFFGAKTCEQKNEQDENGSRNR